MAFFGWQGIALVMFFGSLEGMQRENDTSKSDKTHNVVPATNCNETYLNQLHSDIRQTLFLQTGMLALTSDARDVFIHMRQELNKIDQVVASDYKNGKSTLLLSDQCDLNSQLIELCDPSFSQNSDHIKSFYLPNYIGIACALRTSGAKKALKKYIGDKIEQFKRLDQSDKNRLLFDVMRNCPSKAIARELLNNGADINAQAPSSNYTPLRYAIEHQKRGLVRFLLKQGARADLPDTYSVSPLMCAAVLGDSKIVKTIAKKTLNINRVNFFKKTALYYAAKSGNIFNVITLLKCGASALIGNESENVFVAAVEGRSPAVLQALFCSEENETYFGSINYFLNVALKRSAELGYEEMVVAILQLQDIPSEKRSPVNVNSDVLFEDKASALTKSIELGYASIARLLLDFSKEQYHKLFVDDQRSLALAWSVYQAITLEQVDPDKAADFENITTVLLEDDDPNPLGSKYSSSACYIAADFQNIKWLNTLLEASKKRMDYGAERVLYEAIDNCSVPAVSTTLKCPVNLRACDEYGSTALHRAALSIDEGALAIITLLLQHGADPSHKNSRGVTPVHAAMRNPNHGVHAPIIEALYQAKADLEAQDNWNNVPLHYACSCNKPFITIEAVQSFLKHGVNPDPANKRGDTPLMQAAAYGNHELVLILLDYGADPNKKNIKGDTALSRAAHTASQPVIQSLINAGARISDVKDRMFARAIRHGHTDLAQALLGMGANIAVESLSGANTPLHQAVKKNKVESVVFLLKNGAPVTYKNGEGKTPLEWAVALAQSEIVRLLLEHKN